MRFSNPSQCDHHGQAGVPSLTEDPQGEPRYPPAGSSRAQAGTAPLGGTAPGPAPRQAPPMWGRTSPVPHLSRSPGTSQKRRWSVREGHLLCHLLVTVSHHLHLAQLSHAPHRSQMDPSARMCWRGHHKDTRDRWDQGLHDPNSSAQPQDHRLGSWSKHTQQEGSGWQWQDPATAGIRAPTQDSTSQHHGLVPVARATSGPPAQVGSGDGDSRAQAPGGAALGAHDPSGSPRVRAPARTRSPHLLRQPPWRGSLKRGGTATRAPRCLTGCGGSELSQLRGHRPKRARCPPLGTGTGPAPPPAAAVIFTCLLVTATQTHCRNAPVQRSRPPWRLGD